MVPPQWCTCTNFFLGGVPCENRLQKKVGTLTLTSLLEDLVQVVAGRPWIRIAGFGFEELELQVLDLAVGQNEWYRFGVGAPPISEPILVVGLGCAAGVGLGYILHFTSDSK